MSRAPSGLAGARRPSPPGRAAGRGQRRLASFLVALLLAATLPRPALALPPATEDDEGPAQPAPKQVPAPPPAATDRPAVAPPQAPADRMSHARPGWRRGARLAGWVLAGVGAALAVGAGVALALRVDYGSQWNDDARCLAGGRYRISNCLDVRNRAIGAEDLGVDLAAGAGALGVTALVLLLSSRPDGDAEQRRPAAAIRCAPGPGAVGLACGASF